MSTNKALIDGEEGGKTPAAQHCGLETQRKKVLEEENCSLLSCLHPLHKVFYTSFSFQSYKAQYSHFLLHLRGLQLTQNYHFMAL